MSAKKRPTKRAEGKRRLGPVGADVKIDWHPHAEDRFSERLSPLGVTRADVEEGFREANMKRADERSSPPHPSDYVNRHVRVESSDGHGFPVRVTFRTVSPGTLDGGAPRVQFRTVVARSVRGS